MRLKPRTFLLGPLLLLFCAGCKEELFHDLDELRANQVRLVLEKSGIAAEKNRSGNLWNIRVSTNLVARALTAIEESRVLVRDLERFKEQSSGVVQSREERGRWAERQQAWGLEQTLERIPGVREARVHLRLVEESSFGFSKPQEKESASILLVVAEERESLKEEARKIISGGTGMTAESVLVITSLAVRPFLHSKELPLEPPEGSQASVVLLLLGLIFILLSIALGWVRGRRLTDEGLPVPAAKPGLQPLSVLQREASSELQ